MDLAWDLCGVTVVDVARAPLAEPATRPSFALAHVAGHPLACILLDRSDDWAAAAAALATSIDAELPRLIIEQALRRPCPPEGYDLTDLSVLNAYGVDARTVTVAVCTTGMRSTLERTVARLAQAATPARLLVVRNGPVDAAFAARIRTIAPAADIAYEPRPGLDWARNAAIAAVTTPIIAFVDDDVLVSDHWLEALAESLDERDAVSAVTGLVVPAELATPAQFLFERYAGFGRGCRDRWWQYELAATDDPTLQFRTWEVGTGANMAFRRDALIAVGGFDPAFDAGTPTRGAGDLELFYRLLRGGYEIRYAPRAWVAHIHRRDEAALHRQIASFGSFLSLLQKVAAADHSEWLRLLAMGPYMARYFAWRVGETLGRSPAWPLGMVLAEAGGYARAATGWPLIAARRHARMVAGDSPKFTSAGRPWPTARPHTSPHRIAIELSLPIHPHDLPSPGWVEIEIRRAARPIGKLRLYSPHGRVTPPQLRYTISRAVGRSLARSDQAGRSVLGLIGRRPVRNEPGFTLPNEPIRAAERQP